MTRLIIDAAGLAALMLLTLYYVVLVCDALFGVAS